MSSLSDSVKQIDQLTFTRFIAAVTVIYYHYGQGIFPFNHHWVDQLFLVGNISVSYFYALSGFIMAVVYSRDGMTRFDKVKYWQARFSRIYPVYLLALLATITLLNPRHDHLAKKIFSILMIQSWIPGYPMSYNVPGWSVSVEMFFYILFPFIIVPFSKAPLRKVVTAVALFWFASNLLHISASSFLGIKPPSGGFDFLYYLPLLHLNTFFCGVATGMAYLRYGAALAGRQKLNSALLVGSAVVICTILLNRSAIEASLRITVALTNGLMAPLFLAFIVALSCHRGAITNLFSKRAAVFLGDSSYSMYILHVPIHLGMQKFLRACNIQMPKADALHLYVAVVIALSIASYMLIEKPARKWLRHLYATIADRSALQRDRAVTDTECQHSPS